MVRYFRRFLRVSGSTVFFLLLGCSFASAQTKQEHIHHMGSAVMPFDLGKTIHIFRMTDNGGNQQVVVKDASETDQITRIRQHLKHEAEAFQRGEYADPAALHGADMPGLKDLQTGAKQIRVSYSDLPNGAEITFETTNLQLLTAVHRWFGAQLSEHGADAITQ